MSQLAPVARACQEIANAVKTVAGLRVDTTIARTVTPPAVIVGPPRLEWGGYGRHGLPQTATWNVYLVVALGEYSIDQLLDTVADVTAAIEVHSRGVVHSAGPGSYPSPQGPLPCYVIVCQAEII